ncbi:hypothetical protein SAMN06265222_106201 [Neorhodopirellula lusitana]|uniref:Zinc-ribbon domain-containing protein n=1 Tax=Neorhodopirellula lusitana TaxID=445327 RepID=A0ABY1Q4D7_9BACT|nr:putative zinc-binding metallopeptidase [Neorhodopirellula lusitana]SMP59286.1 hypothetical protein SAMN06265222_106201 [Neorhodopirellula lusitana]
MKTGQCRCGNRIFFANSVCLNCQATLGRCDACKTLTSFRAVDSAYQCDDCGASMQPCGNRERSGCNSYISDDATYCQWCGFTTTIPDLGVPENSSRWAALELAKRRLLMQLESLELPPFVGNLQETHPLTFRFLDDTTNDQGEHQTTFTGHESGQITINTKEADSVHREQLRVQLGEPHRTLIGHMRHELGHYIDWSLASRVALSDYKKLFGDPDATDYGEAMKRYYAQGAAAKWADQHVSCYATMHPWEDFAETCNAYLDIMAIAETANDQSMAKLDLSPSSDCDSLVASVLNIVVAVSEFNSDLGLQPLLPERLPPAVMEKLSYIHSLRRRSLDTG